MAWVKEYGPFTFRQIEEEYTDRSKWQVPVNPEKKTFRIATIETCRRCQAKFWRPTVETIHICLLAEEYGVKGK